MYKRQGPNVVCYSRPAVYAYVSNFVSISLFCRPLLAKTPNFAVFWTSAFSGVAIGSRLRKLNTGAQLQTFPYPMASKSLLYSNPFMAKSGAQFPTFKSVTDRQTDKQTKNSTFLAAPAVGEFEHNQSWRHADRLPRARSCTSKTWGSDA